MDYAASISFLARILQCDAPESVHVICVDNDSEKVKQLKAGEIPIYEPGLEEIVHRNVSAQRLHFTGNIQEAVERSQIIFIAVPTPPLPDGDVDLSFVEKVAREIAGVLSDYRVIVDKSTVPVKTGEKVAESIKRYNRHGRPLLLGRNHANGAQRARDGLNFHDFEGNLQIQRRLRALR